MKNITNSKEAREAILALLNDCFGDQDSLQLILDAAIALKEESN